MYRVMTRFKWMGYLLIALSLFAASGWLLALWSHKGDAPGLVNGRLSPCPSTPNCVCSEYPQRTGAIGPLHFSGDAEKAWAQARTAVKMTGGRIVRDTEHYLAATYSSRLFRFVDDVELRLDGTGRMIHLRSASRVGHYDFGANARRTAQISALFAERSAGQ